MTDQPRHPGSGSGRFTTQQTDPLREAAREPDVETRNVSGPAEDVLPDLVRDPGKGDTGGAPTWKGFTSADIE